MEGIVYCWCSFHNFSTSHRTVNAVVKSARFGPQSTDNSAEAIMLSDFPASLAPHRRRSTIVCLVRTCTKGGVPSSYIRL